LPEYQTDFIFAAFAEEWGFAGIVILFALYGILIWRIVVNASKGRLILRFYMGLALLSSSLCISLLMWA
jgi:rod shape determining protein RodA